MKINMKSKGILFVDYFEKTDKGIIKTDSIMAKTTRKELESSFEEDKKNGFDHKIEYVNEKPTEFQFGVIYLLKTPAGRPDYIYTHQLTESD